jgi:hypothetical protein
VAFGDFAGGEHPSAANIKRVSDGLATAILDQSRGEGESKTAINSPTDNVILTVADATGFVVDDLVYVEPEVIPVEGDVDWRINTPMNTYNPIPNAVYRETNRWTGQVLFSESLGHLAR